jgi:aspartyl-tRNA(Asn)/glutamyl-tRNA(Gln) amidotransferase subunit A
MLRNPSIGNFFGLCGISLPLPAPLPVGLMLLARNGHDRRLMRIAAATSQLFGA